MPTSAAIARIPLQKRVVHRLPVPSVEPAPFVKWVGGKGRILPKLLPLLPPAAERLRHVEPFLGGGAMFFARQPSRALLSDVNAELVSAYRSIRDDVEGVIAHLHELAIRHDRDYFYATRARYNATAGGDAIERAAMFIYLNKTCFNGLHRVNRKGEFNVPMGRYKNPRILDEDGLRAASLTLALADIRNTSFENLLSTAKPGDFVYFDPPYEPLSSTANFTAYAQSGFAREDQTRLRDVFAALDRRGAKLMLSNSDVPFIRDLYRHYRLDVVRAPRAVSCKGNGRGNVNEVVIRNY